MLGVVQSIIILSYQRNINIRYNRQDKQPTKKIHDYHFYFSFTLTTTLYIKRHTVSMPENQKQTSRSAVIIYINIATLKPNYQN